MKQLHQNRIIQGVLALPVAWILWDALRTLAAAAATFIVAAPSTRSIGATVFLAAYGFVPGVAMAGCALLAGALALRYPEQDRARSLALLCVCVGFVFATFLIPTLFATLGDRGVPLVPALPLPSAVGGGLVFLAVALGPAFFLWFTASFPDVPDWTAVTGRLRAAARGQRIMFRTPLVVVVGLLPLLVLAVVGQSVVSVMAVVLGTFALGFASLWLTHRSLPDPVPGRTRVVALSLAVPLLPMLSMPLADLLPRYTPFFAMDVMVLIWALGLCFMVLGLTYAVFVKGVVGPGLVIRRSALIGVGGTVGLFLFAGLEELASDFALDTLGLPSRLGTFVSAAVLAVAFTFVRDRWKKLRAPAPPAVGVEEGSEAANV